MISAAGLFALLLLAYFMNADAAKKNARRKSEELEKAYSDKNLAKMEYDVAVYDDETRKLMDRSRSEAQVTIDDVIVDEKKSAAPSADDVKPSAGEILFGKVDGEGVEEITGNFKGDEK